MVKGGSVTDGLSTDDWQLLRRFTKNNSQEAFAALTARYLSLVYSVCLREVHDLEMAQDVTQAVFLLLARPALASRSKTALPGIDTPTDAQSEDALRRVGQVKPTAAAGCSGRAARRAGRTASRRRHRRRL